MPRVVPVAAEPVSGAGGDELWPWVPGGGVPLTVVLYREAVAGGGAGGDRLAELRSRNAAGGGTVWARKSRISRSG